MRSTYNQKRVLLPNSSPILSEFMGLLAGDGHLGPETYSVEVFCSLAETHYASHVQHIIDKLFFLSAKKTPHTRGEYRIRVYSKELYLFLSQKHQFPTGKKKGKLHIPPIGIKFPNDYMRGLFDTDGSFYERGNRRGVVNICSRDEIFLREVADLFVELNYHPSVSGKDLYLYRINEITRFFREIRPANKKHTQKYTTFLKTRAKSSLFKKNQNSL